ncbi:unnamed protein product [Brugia timori]|uniref:Transposase n=1 Tax=Brugia timori TaxID=42155 RepID=A0A0R3RA64_9BILA|nr:unnamed protein product [Brugia timori]
MKFGLLPHFSGIKLQEPETYQEDIPIAFRKLAKSGRKIKQ